MFPHWKNSAALNAVLGSPKPSQIIFIFPHFLGNSFQKIMEKFTTKIVNKF